MLKLNRFLTICSVVVLATSTLSVIPTFAESSPGSLQPVKSPKKPKSGLTGYNNGNLELKFVGIKAVKGQVCAKLFTGGNGFPNADKGANIKAATCAPIVKGTAKIIFERLPYGNYAVASVHDTNGDRKLNSNFLGMPEEGFGFSNNPKVVTSPPSFGEAQFFVSGATTELQIQMQYLN